MYTSFKSLVYALVGVGNTLVSVLIAGLVALLIYTGTMYIYYAGNKPEEGKKYRTTSLWGLLGLFLVMSMWGILRLVSGGLLGDSLSGSVSPSSSEPSASWSYTILSF